MFPIEDLKVVVLVVDDSGPSACEMASQLKKQGYSVHVAHDEAGALEMARSYPPDVVLLDPSLPGLDGSAIARTLCAELPQRPLFVAMSAYGHPEVIEQSKREGFDQHFFKPVDPVRFTAYLEQRASRCA